MNAWRSLACGSLFVWLAGTVVGCAVPLDDEDTRATSSSQRIVRVADIMARAQEWVDKRVPYCGGVRGGPDVLCGGTCSRPAAPWDKYRSDCSGFVSWVWHLPDVPTTDGFMRDRGGDDGWRTISIDELKRGDAVVCDGHIKLFAGFASPTSAEIYEEYSCGQVARRTVQSFTRIDGRSFRFAGDGRIYHAIRRNGVTDDGAGGGSDTVGEGSQVFLTGGQQHFFGRAPNGELSHAFWDPSDRRVHRDTWGRDIAGPPVTFVTGTQQHAFARGAGGGLEHWFWDASTKKITHDTWGQGIVSDPSVILMGGGQHAFAVDAAGRLQHWYWGPNKPVQNDVWGEGVVGRPTTLESGVEQHVFARGQGGSLEHFWWEPKEGVHHDTWATSIESEPVARLINGDQHVFAIDAAGALQHWWWGPKTRVISHDTWATGGLDPSGRPAIMIKGFDQHVFARGADGGLEHYFWQPNVGVRHDTWGRGITSDPSAMLVGDDEHVFVQADDGAVDHWWWTKASGIQHDRW